MRRTLIVGLFVGCSMIAAACGDSSSSDDAAEATVAPSPTPTPTPLTTSTFGPSPTPSPTSCAGDAPQIDPITSPTTRSRVTVSGTGVCGATKFVSVDGPNDQSFTFLPCSGGAFSAEIQLERGPNIIRVCQHSLCAGACTELEIVRQ